MSLSVWFRRRWAGLTNAMSKMDAIRMQPELHRRFPYVHRECEVFHLPGELPVAEVEAIVEYRARGQGFRRKDPNENFTQYLVAADHFFSDRRP